MAKKLRDYLVEGEKIWQLPLFIDEKENFTEKIPGTSHSKNVVTTKKEEVKAIFSQENASENTKKTIATKKDTIKKIVKNTQNEPKKNWEIKKSTPQKSQKNPLKRYETEIFLGITKCELLLTDGKEKNQITLKIRRKWDKKYYTFKVYLENFSFEREVKRLADDEERFYLRDLKIHAIQKTDAQGRVYSSSDRGLGIPDDIRNFNYFSYLFEKGMNIHPIFMQEIQYFLLKKNIENRKK